MEVIEERLFSIIKWLVVQILFEFVFYWIGRSTFQVFSFQRYSPLKKTSSDFYH